MIERVRLHLFAIAYSELRHYEDAQDAVSEAIFHICRHVVDLREPGAIRPWMHTIVRNETHRLRRGKQASMVTLDEADSNLVHDPSPLLRLDIERALKQLPADQARTMWLYYLSRWPILKIAHHLDRPKGTIKRWLHEGRENLTIQMKGYVTMENEYKACIIATDITKVQLESLTHALKLSGWKNIHTVTDMKSIDDLYSIDKGVLQQLGPGCELPMPELAEPLAGSHCLFLGEKIAGRSPFEFIPIVRAIHAHLPVCLLLDQREPSNPVDSTIYAAWLTGIDLCISLEQEASEYQYWFTKLRENLATNGFVKENDAM